MRIVAAVIAGVVVIAAAGIAVFVATFDPNSRKPQIIAAVQAATGRELTIGGQIGLSISLQPTLEMTDVSLGNPPGFSRPQMVSLQKLQLQVALVPLLSRQLRIVRLVLQQPDILLETNAQGESNWMFAAAGPPGAGAPAGPSSAPPAPPPLSALLPSAKTTAPQGIALSSVQIEGGTLAFRNAKGRTTTLGLNTLAARQAAPSAPLHLTMDATYRGTPVGLTADTGPLAGVMGSAGDPWPVKFAVTAAGATLTAEGTVAQPDTLRGLALAVDAAIPDLAALSPIAGTQLPKLQAIAAQFRLVDAAGAGGVGAAISDLKLTLPNADLAGSVSVIRGVRPLLTANLSGKQVDLDAIMQALGMKPVGVPAPGRPGAPAATGGSSAPVMFGGSVAPMAPEGPATPVVPGGSTAPVVPVGPATPATQAGRSDHMIADHKLPFEALRHADADVQLALDNLRTGGVDYKSIKLHAVNKDGKLTLDPLTLDAPGGQVNLQATVDTNRATPPVTLNLRAPGLALQPLFQALHRPGYASGSLELRADLSGAGDTPRAIAASLDGPIGAAVAGGEIDSAILAGLMAELVQRDDLTKGTDLTKLVRMSRVSKLHCFALRIDSARGIGTLAALQLDTNTLDMTGSGTLDFGAETLDLHLRPMADLGGANIEAPVIVTGSFARPIVKSDPLGGDAGGAGTPAAAAGNRGLTLIIGSAREQKSSGDACAAPLALARFGSVPPATAQPSDEAPAGSQKPPKPRKNPLDTLRKLFQ